MALPRPSNQDRARWRTKCREKLSKHIKSKLGISIDPSEVRLITRVEDPYSWQSLPVRTHLFKKNLSKHSIGAYMELCREVGISFKAVVKENILFTRPAANFTNRIAELEAENSRLIGEVNKLKDTAAAESTFKRDAEEAANQLTVVLHTAELENQHLKRDIQKWATIAEDFRVSTADSHQIVNEASLVLEKLKSLLPSICM
ncbi:uncharacterized protein LY89DRAFT_724351 [Mollisia scopiformis]|uniref:Uncharacterized protein n=1 Tax=Mollisia scopiformis TaxID=149040 RepID=A0A132BA91_MOLSC|nr:uncharacterized protein LY89DRAFT_724351 [Mollisia scopiformis]KUJ09325.1 hypothetical protein LY89DRAFT_724351 [Mollisia scopiformis]